MNYFNETYCHSVGEEVFYYILKECEIKNTNSLNEISFKSLKNSISLLKNKWGEISGFINKKVDDLGTKLQNTQPVKNIDAEFEKQKNKIAQTIQSSDSPAAKRTLEWVSKIGQLAKQNPKTASVALGLLAASVGVASGPIGFGIVGKAYMPIFIAGLNAFLKSSLELLKGGKLSSAVGSGAKTFATTYLVGKAVSSLADLATRGAIKIATVISTGFETSGEITKHSIQISYNSTGQPNQYRNVIVYFTQDMANKFDSLKDGLSKIKFLDGIDWNKQESLKLALEKAKQVGKVVSKVGTAATAIAGGAVAAMGGKQNQKQSPKGKGGSQQKGTPSHMKAGQTTPTQKPQVGTRQTKTNQQMKPTQNPQTRTRQTKAGQTTPTQKPQRSRDAQFNNVRKKIDDIERNLDAVMRRLKMK